MRRAGYGPDLARIHHEGFGDVPRAASAIVLSSLRAKHPSGLIVELGCGSGIMTRVLTDAGYDVTGIDFSPEMLRLARAHAPKARFVLGSAFETEIPSCVAVTAVGEVLCYRFDGSRGGAALGRLFNRVFRALEPGGIFVFDVSSPGRGGPGGTLVRVRDAKDWTIVLNVGETRDRLTRRHTVFIRSGDRYRRVDETHELSLYPPEEITSKLRTSGFRVRKARGYGEVEIGPGWWTFVATKPGRANRAEKPPRGR